MNQPLTKPAALHPGDTIGIMAPSSRVDKKALAAGVRALEAQGFKVYIHPQTFAEHGQSAGTAAEKAEALHDLYRNPDIKAIFAACGGNRSGWLLEKLDYELIRQNPKILIGYSDVTALLAAINRKTGQAVFHGPTALRCGETFGNKEQLCHCFNLLQGGETEIPFANAKTLRQGTVSGRLVGGNLSLICSLLGTAYEPDFKDAILFLEDCGDELSHIDRMFAQLRNAGVFDKIKGLVLGGFTNLKDTGKKPFALSLTDIVNEAIAGKNIPAVVMEAPFGHADDMYTLPFGVKATLETTDKAKLKLDGPAVAG